MMYGNGYTNLPVLVTGGCGFIGSHICETLVTLGAQVTVLDDLSSGTLANIEHIKDKIRFIHASVTDRHMCLEATQGQQLIFHLAALVSVPESVKNPVLCHEINSSGTHNMLEAARINNVRKIVFSSSAAVYGSTESICSEDMPCNPESPYGYSKYIAELLCQQYSRVYGLETVILRYFNVYGPRQNPHNAYAGVVAKFNHQMEHDAPITIFGNGLQTRDFIHVNLVVQANLTLAMTHMPQGTIFNIATGKSMTLLQLIDQLRKQYPRYDQQIMFEVARAGDIKSSRADCSKYQSLLRQGHPHIGTSMSHIAPLYPIALPETEGTLL